MDYFFDTEFHEDGSKNQLELISLGIVREDGKTYYAQAIETSHKQCNPWVQANVIPKLTLCPRGVHRDEHKWILKGRCGDSNCYWRSFPQMKEDVLEFTKDGSIQWWAEWGAYDWVLLCRLFGNMLDIPKGWKYFLDLYDLEKQALDVVKTHGHPKTKRPKQLVTDEHHALKDAIHLQQMHGYFNSIIELSHIKTKVKGKK